MIYFVQASVGGPVKIGTAGNVKSRVADIQSCCPFPLRLLLVIDGGYAKENELHLRFASARLHGEWFRPVPELVEFIGIAPEPEEIMGQRILRRGMQYGPLVRRDAVLLDCLTSDWQSTQECAVASDTAAGAVAIGFRRLAERYGYPVERRQRMSNSPRRHWIEWRLPVSQIGSRANSKRADLQAESVAV